MPPAQWPIQNDRPPIQIVLTLLGRGQDVVRRLVADTGAGTRQSVFQIILGCVQCALARLLF